jgi:electron transfer flavoprotein beta subunit
VQIVVLVKPVPDPAAGAERLGPNGWLDRPAAPAVVNANDEYALEAALKLVEAHGGEVTLLSMAPPTAPETMRKALAMGAQRGVLVTDESSRPRSGSSHSTSSSPARTHPTVGPASCRPASQRCSACRT